MTRRRPVVYWHARTLSVLVPVLNERENLGPTVERLLQALGVTVEDFEILIVNDGSSDGTREIADQLAAENPRIRAIHNETNMGLGHAYQRGIDEARMNFFVYIPGDNTWPLRSLLELFGNLGKADVVTSFTTNPHVRPFFRRIVSAGYTQALNLLFSHHMQYYNGLTIYPAAFLKARKVTTSGFGFQAETLLFAMHEGMSVVECALPIDERTAGGSKAVNARNISSVLATMARMLWRLRLGPLLRGRGPEARPRARRWGAAVGPSVDEMSLHPRLGPVPERDARVKPRPEQPLTIVITGASSGIGAALCTALAKDGHRVFICARRKDRMEQVTQDGSLARSFVCDVSDEQAVKRFAEFVRQEGERVDVLINCAGKFGAIGALASTDSEEWFDTLRVNLFGPYLVSKHFLPLLANAESPRIINLAGGGAFSPFPNYSAYACSKSAIVRLTECMAAELAAEGIAVNALAPGVIATEAHEATLRAGEVRAGAMQYRRTVSVMKDGGASMENVIDCVNAMLSPQMEGLTGKTLSASFDPWSTESFLERIPDITRSDLYTSRRYNIVNLPAGSLRKELSTAWAHYANRS